VAPAQDAVPAVPESAADEGAEPVKKQPGKPGAP